MSVSRRTKLQTHLSKVSSSIKAPKNSLDPLQEKQDKSDENIYKDKPKLLEDFLVIGVDEEDILNLQDSIESQALEQNPDELRLQAKILFMHSGKKDCQRRKVVKDFCFPDLAEE